MEEKLRLTHRVMYRGNVRAYKGIFIEGPRKGEGFLIGKAEIWVYASEGQVENVRAYGNPVFPEIGEDGCPLYTFPQSELNKMRLRGINGFKLSTLPEDNDFYGGPYPIR